MYRYSSQILILTMLSLVGCTSAPVQKPAREVLPLVDIKPMVKANFCTAGTPKNLGGIATQTDDIQYAIGKCARSKWTHDDLMILYFGDPGSLDTDEYLAEELDSIIHPEDYLTQKEVAEMDCTDGSACKANAELLKKGILVHFETDSDVPLNKDEIEMVQKVARNNKDKGVVLAVTGHTDNTATESHNKPLSLRRAKAIQKILLDNGLTANLVVLRARSSSMPVASNATTDGRALNRRVVVTDYKTEVTNGN